MNILDNPNFEDMPYRIETNKMDQVIMTPHAMNHSDYQVEIPFILNELITHGRISVECAIQTTDGLKTADITWRTRIVNEKICTVIPELCIEIKSPSNTMSEMHHKKGLYLNNGGREFWLCIDGDLSFFDDSGEIALSVLFPSFPKIVKL